MSTTILPPIDLSASTILGDAVYECIGAAILDGRLAPGQRLRDVELAAQLGVSRTPVREALQRLERFGLVEIAVGRYTRVTEPDERMRDETGAFAVYAMGNALHMAVARCSDDELAGIVTAADAVVAAAADDDPLRLFDLSVSLFERVTLATDNAVFTTFIGEASLAILRNVRGWMPFHGQPQARLDDHARVRDCIARRDADGAERALRRLFDIV